MNVWPSKKCVTLLSTSLESADDTAIAVCLSDQSFFVSYLDEIDTFRKWCGDFCFTMNVCKTKEMILDFRKGHNHEPGTINGKNVEFLTNYNPGHYY